MRLHLSLLKFSEVSQKSLVFSKAFLLLFCLLIYFSAPIVSKAREIDPLKVHFSEKPEHAILYIIDGLSYKVWNRVELPILEKMVQTGTLVEKDYLPPSAHPTHGPYAELHTCSIPNPVMMAGTIFITKETEYLPQKFFPEKTTAFVANTDNYDSLDRYYNYSYQKLGPDPEGVKVALQFIKMWKPAFMRFHLQEVGEASYQIMKMTEDLPWRGNIWAKGSPYIEMLKQADNLLGSFLQGLEEAGILDKTVILVMGDHGEADSGYHPPQIKDASITSILLWGAGVKQGVKIPYAEHIDVVPTICALMNVESPRTCQGRVIAEALSNFHGEIPPREMNLKKLIEQFEEYQKGEAAALNILMKIKSERARWYRGFNNIQQNFYDIHRFSEWPRFKTIKELIDHNQKALDRLHAFLVEIQKRGN
jgi:hypothetical protein